MSKTKVLMTRPDVPPVAVEMIKAKCDLEIYQEEKPIPKKDLLKMIPGKSALYCMLTDPIDKEVIEAAGPDLKAIATMSVGYEHIDLETCRQKGIKVSNTPHVSTDSVAEWTVTLMLAAGRNFMDSAHAIKEGKWVYSWGPVWLCGSGLQDAIVGIIGMGRIGQAIMKRVLPFGVKKVMYHDMFHPIKAADEMGAIDSELDDLLQQSDFVVCMVNLSAETKEMFNKNAFKKMKESAVFVNTSRGGVVNQDDLYDALKNNVIRAAAIDVTVPEPLPKDHKLVKLPNLIITPHVGSAEIHVRDSMAKLAAENILNVLEGKEMATPVPM